MNSLCLTRNCLYDPVSQAYPTIASPSFPCRSGSLIQIDCHSEASITEKSHVSRWTTSKEILCQSRQGRVTIDVLPDNVLLEIFHCYVDEDLFFNAWHTLVHVSRKWRCVVFDSPRRLNLRLRCSARTPVREMLTIWPPLPIVIWERRHSACNEDNIIAALEHHDRVCEIRLNSVPSPFLEKLFATMQEPFSVLAVLALETKDDTVPVNIPDSFFGRSAPHLRHLLLTHIPFPFPELRKLQLFASNLAHLSLHKIPHFGYFSLEAMVTCLSALTRLEALHFGFESPRSSPYRENRRPPPPTRTLLPALRDLWFTGVSEYLENLVARIDAPLLNHLNMTFFHQLIFDTPQLAHFIARSSHRQNDEAPNGVHVIFSNSGVNVMFPVPFAHGLEVGITCRQSDWQLSALAQVCGSSFPQAFIPTVERLYITENEYFQPHWQDDIENSQWLELLHLFTAVKNLFISQELMPRIAPTLQELVGERANEVLPTLQSIFLEGPHPLGVVSEEIGQFVNARRLSGRPIAVIPWTRYDACPKVDG